MTAKAQYQKARYRRDPEYRRRMIQAGTEYRKRRMAEDPRYLELLKIRQRIYVLRDIIERRLADVAVREQELLERIRERDELAAALRKKPAG